MYYSNYYPYYTYPNMNLHNYSNNKAKNYTQNNNCQTQKETKKDIVNDTIPFESFCNTGTKNNSSKNNKLFSITSQEISICGITMQTDDLIIIAIMILLFIESDENMLLIFVLGLLLLNINLGDIMSIL